MALHVRCLNPTRLKINSFRSVAHSVQTEHRTDSRCHAINDSIRSTDKHASLAIQHGKSLCRQSVTGNSLELITQQQTQVLVAIANAALQELIPTDRDKVKNDTLIPAKNGGSPTDLWNEFAKFRNIRKLNCKQSEDFIPTCDKPYEQVTSDKQTNHIKNKKFVHPLENLLDDMSFVRFNDKDEIFNKRLPQKRDTTSVAFKESLPSNDWTLYYCFQSDNKTSADKAKVPRQGPTEEQLEKATENIKKQMTMFATSFSFDYSFLHPEIVFINNFSGKSKTYRGWNSYIQQVSKFKAMCLLRFVYFELKALNITVKKEEGIIQVRWTLCTLPLWYVAKFWKYSSMLKETHRTYDGVSYFHINSDGKIYKHVLDRIMPDEELKDAATNVVSKLAVLMGMRPSMNNFSNCLSRKTRPNPMETTICHTSQ